MNQPTREEVEAFITALNYGMKVSHKPEFLIALAEGWLMQNGGAKPENCAHVMLLLTCDNTGSIRECRYCGLKTATGSFIEQLKNS